MKTKIIKIASIAAALLSFSICAEARVFTVTTTGTIYSGYDQTNMLGAGTGSLNGREVITTYTFDTNDIPADYYGYSGTTDYYYEQSDWITSTVTIGGVNQTVNEDDVVDNSSRDVDSLYIQDTGSRDFYRVYSYTYDGSPYEYYSSYSYIYEYIDDIIDLSLGGEQEFEWTDEGSSYGYGSFTMRNSNPYERAYGSYRVNSMTVTAAVPEPATFALFGLGLIGLGVIHRKRKA